MSEFKCVTQEEFSRFTQEYDGKLTAKLITKPVHINFLNEENELVARIDSNWPFKGEDKYFIKS